MTVGIVLTKAGALAKNKVRVCAQELMLAFPQHCIVSHEGGSTIFSWELNLSNAARFHSRRMILRVKNGPNEQRGGGGETRASLEKTNRSGNQMWTMWMKKQRCKPGKLPNLKAFLAVRRNQDSYSLLSLQYKLLLNERGEWVVIIGESATTVIHGHIITLWKTKKGKKVITFLPPLGWAHVANCCQKTAAGVSPPPVNWKQAT